MATDRHTPGPWWYDEARNAICYRLPPDRYDEDDDGIRNVVSLFSACGGDDSTADALVMAAAPDLLAVVRTCIEPFARISAEDALRATDPRNRVRGISPREARIVVARREAIAAVEGRRPPPDT